MLVILQHINEVLHYASFDFYVENRTLNKVESCKEDELGERLHKLSTSSDIIDVITIETTEGILEKIKSFNNIKILKTYDSRSDIGKGTHTDNNTNWSVLDSLSRKLQAFNLDGSNPKSYLNIEESNNRFIKEAFNISDNDELAKLSKEDRETVLNKLLNELNQNKEIANGSVQISKTLNRETRFLDYETSINALFGNDFLQRVQIDYPNSNFYLMGEFLNHSYIIEILRQDNNRTVHYKNEKEAIRFYMEGALSLYKDQVKEEFEEKLKQNPNKSITDYEKMYEAHPVRYFYTFDEVKPEIKPADEEGFKKYVDQEIGKKTDIVATEKDKLIKIGKTEYNIIDSTWVGEHIDRTLKTNKEEKKSIEDEIVTKINTLFFKSPSVFFNSNKRKKIKNEIKQHNVKGYSINIDALFDTHYNSIETAINNPKANLPPGIPSKVIKEYIDKINKKKKLFAFLGIVSIVIVIYVIIKLIGPTTPPPPPTPTEGPYDDLIAAIETDGLDKEEAKKLFDIVIDPSEDDDEVYNLIEGEFVGKNIPDSFYSWKVNAQLVYQLVGSMEKSYEIKDFLDLLFGQQNRSTIKSIELLDFNKNDKSIKLKIDYK